VEDREDYIAALIASRKAGNAGPFRVFMAGQLLKSLREEHAGQPADDGSSGFVF
jgi:hypothetical protein